MSSRTYSAYCEVLPDEAKKRYNAKLDKLRTAVDDPYATMPSAQPAGHGYVDAESTVVA